MGKSVSQFFKRVLGITAGSNIIRGMVEREAERFFRRDIITAEEREAVRSTNGHNDQITRDFYLLNSRRDERKSSRRFAQLLTGDQEDDEDEANMPDLVDDDEASDDDEQSDPFRYQRLWGTKHPDTRQGSNIRVVWSPAEIKYIRLFESKLRVDARRNGISEAKVLKTLALRWNGIYL
jgi:hypothetical protein